MARTEAERGRRKPKFDLAGFNDAATAFHTQVAENPDLIATLPPSERQFYLSYLNSSTRNLKTVGAQNRVSHVTARRRILSAIELLYSSLPEDIQEVYALDSVLRLREPVRRTPVTTEEVVFVSPEKSAPRRRSGWESNAYLFDKPKPSAESNNGAEPKKKSKEEIFKKKYKKVLERQLEFTNSQRVSDPHLGAQLNFLYLEQNIDQSLRDFYKDNPDLQADGFNDYISRTLMHPYITFQEGEIYYIHDDYKVPMNFESIENKYRGGQLTGNRDADPVTVERFGLIGFDTLISGVKRAAIKAGYSSTVQA